MTTLLLVATCLNLILLLGLSFNIFLRIKEKKEDHRMNKGLQLLQHKIAILQDLSDKTDEQVYRLVHHLDKKSNDLKKMTSDANEAISFFKNKNNILTPQELIDSKKSTDLEMDQFNQFAKAISLQNERLKRTETLPVSENIPQTFIESAPHEVKNIEVKNIEKKNSVRPFEFRRI